MQDYLWTFSNEEGKKFDKSECPFILKYSKHLSEQNSLIESINSIYALLIGIDLNTSF